MGSPGPAGRPALPSAMSAPGPLRGGWAEPRSRYPAGQRLSGFARCAGWIQAREEVGRRFQRGEGDRSLQGGCVGPCVIQAVAEGLWRGVCVGRRQPRAQLAEQSKEDGSFLW